MSPPPASPLPQQQPAVNPVDSNSNAENLRATPTNTHDTNAHLSPNAASGKSPSRYINYKTSESITDKIQREDFNRNQRELLKQRRKFYGLPGDDATSHLADRTVSGSSSPQMRKKTTAEESSDIKTNQTFPSNSTLKQLLFTWPEEPRGPKSAHALQERIRYHRHGDRDHISKVPPQYRTMSGQSVCFANFWDDPIYLDPLKDRLIQKPLTPAKLLEESDQFPGGSQTPPSEDSSPNNKSSPGSVTSLEEYSMTNSYRGVPLPTHVAKNKYKDYRKRYEKSVASRSSGGSLYSVSRRSSISTVPPSIASSSPRTQELPSPVRDQGKNAKRCTEKRAKVSRQLPQIQKSPDAKNSPSRKLRSSGFAWGASPRSSSSLEGKRHSLADPVKQHDSQIPKRRPSAHSTRSEPLDLDHTKNHFPHGPSSVQSEPIDLSGHQSAYSPRNQAEYANQEKESSKHSEISSNHSNQRRYNLGGAGKELQRPSSVSSVSSIKSKYLKQRKNLPLRERYSMPVTQSMEYGWSQSKVGKFVPKDSSHSTKNASSHLMMTQGL